MNRYLAVAVAVVSMSGCGEEVSPEGPASVTETYPRLQAGEDEASAVNLDVPIARIEVLPGVTAAFYAWEDLSAGYLLASSVGMPSIAESDLAGLSIAEVFWALCPADAVVPDALLAHHSALVADGDRPAWNAAVAGLEQGWASGTTAPDSLAACSNSTFNTNHCALGGSSDPYKYSNCWFDNNQSHETDVFGELTGGARRHKAGFCLDAGGSVFDQLGWTNRCSDTGALIWWGVFESDWYATWEWIAPTSASPRRWQHQGTTWPGTPVGYRDWASKYGYFNFCP